MKSSSQLLIWTLAGITAVLAGCSFAPKYKVPAPPGPTAFKENTVPPGGDTNLWQTAQPMDAATRGKWWLIFNEPELSGLEDLVTVSNQNIAAAFANLMSARAVVRETRAQLFPTLTANPSITRSRSAFLGQSGTSGTPRTVTDYTLSADATWEPDLWGRIRNQIKANAYEAQATAADLENIRLSAQAELASDYFQLRAQDTLAHILQETVKAYEESLHLAKVRQETGIASDQDVAQAETQLKTTEAQASNVGILRAQLEHAIATLTGRMPVMVSLPTQLLNTNHVAPPEAVPSTLLERRPDIAAAERRVAEANAQIGVARAAYFPNLTLSASGGLESIASSTLFTWPARFWSIGAGMTETIFDAGARGAAVSQFKAEYDRTVAQYRQTVLTGFQQVEDNLAALRILATEIQQQDDVVKASQNYLDLANERYRLGIDSYLNVITAQTTLLGNRQTLLNLHSQQLTATVQLITALGGGWDAAQLGHAGVFSAGKL